MNYGTTLADLAKQYNRREDWIAHELINARLRRGISNEPLQQHELNSFTHHMRSVSLPPSRRGAECSVPTVSKSGSRTASASKKPRQTYPKILDEKNKRAIVFKLHFADNVFRRWVHRRSLPPLTNQNRLKMLSEGRPSRNSLEQKILDFLQSKEFKTIKRKIIAELKRLKEIHGPMLAQKKQERERLEQEKLQERERLEQETLKTHERVKWERLELKQLARDSMRGPYRGIPPIAELHAWREQT